MNPRDLNILALYRDDYIDFNPNRTMPYLTSERELEDMLRELPGVATGIWIRL